MRRHFVVCELLVACVCLSPLSESSAYHAEAQDVLYTIRRAQPPVASATAEELESAGDKLRSEAAYLDALDYYQAARAKKPNNARVINKLGIVELQMQRYKQARKDFEKAIKLEPTFASTYNNLGAVYFAQKKYGAAIKQYQKAIQLAPGSATYYANMGAAYFAKREYEPAGINYARAMELDPDVLERHARAGISAGMLAPEDLGRYAFALAKLYAAKGAIDRSLVYLKRAIEEGYKGIEVVYKDSAFAALRKDPRFVELMVPKPLAFVE
jgi:tetratricopeptide (TPR) repeat protein